MRKMMITALLLFSSASILADETEREALCEKAKVLVVQKDKMKTGSLSPIEWVYFLNVYTFYQRNCVRVKL